MDTSNWKFCAFIALRRFDLFGADVCSFASFREICVASDASVDDSVDAASRRQPLLSSPDVFRFDGEIACNGWRCSNENDRWDKFVRYWCDWRDDGENAAHELCVTVRTRKTNCTKWTLPMGWCGVQENKESFSNRPRRRLRRTLGSNLILCLETGIKRLLTILLVALGARHSFILVTNETSPCKSNRILTRDTT